MSNPVISPCKVQINIQQEKVTFEGLTKKFNKYINAYKLVLGFTFIFGEENILQVEYSLKVFYILPFPSSSNQTDGSYSFGMQGILQRNKWKKKTHLEGSDSILRNNAERGQTWTDLHPPNLRNLN